MVIQLKTVTIISVIFSASLLLATQDELFPAATEPYSDEVLNELPRTLDDIPVSDKNVFNAMPPQSTPEKPFHVQRVPKTPPRPLVKEEPPREPIIETPPLLTVTEAPAVQAIEEKPIVPINNDVEVIARDCRGRLNRLWQSRKANVSSERQSEFQKKVAEASAACRQLEDFLKARENAQSAAKRFEDSARQAEQY